MKKEQATPKILFIYKKNLNVDKGPVIFAITTTNSKEKSHAATKYEVRSSVVFTDHDYQWSYEIEDCLMHICVKCTSDIIYLRKRQANTEKELT